LPLKTLSRKFCCFLLRRRQSYLGRHGDAPQALDQRSKPTALGLAVLLDQFARSVRSDLRLPAAPADRLPLAGPAGRGRPVLATTVPESEQSAVAAPAACFACSRCAESHSS